MKRFFATDLQNFFKQRVKRFLATNFTNYANLGLEFKEKFQTLRAQRFSQRAQNRKPYLALKISELVAVILSVFCVSSHSLE